MHDDIDALEAELKGLRPADPSAAVRQRIDAELRAQSRATHRLRWIVLGAMPLGAAAILLFAFHPAGYRAGIGGGQRKPVTIQPPADAFTPVSARTVVYSAADEGLLTLADGTPARSQRFESVEIITWRNPRTHASLTWSVPREEVRVVPVRYQ